MLRKLAMHGLEDVRTDLQRLQLALSFQWALMQLSGDITTSSNLLVKI